jgi:ABC-type branched-subunit amino acid transport system substrate-binding protein
VSLTPRLEVDLLADYATRELGARNFAILHPKDDYGLELRNLFWDAVERRGGRIVGAAGYDVDATDFAAPIRSLVGFQLLGSAERAAIRKRDQLLDQAKRSTRERARELRAEAAALRGPNDQPLPPFVDFDALFIPDSHENVVLIAPQLAFHEVRGVRLLGPSGWNHPDLVEIGRKHVDGAIFTGNFVRESGLSSVAEFGRRYQATFGRSADSLAAEAYDATNLLLDQLARRRDGRRALSSGLRQVRAVAGVSGVISIRADGNADKRAHLLGVQRGRIVSVDETGEPPYLRAAPARAGN